VLPGDYRTRLSLSICPAERPSCSRLKQEFDVADKHTKSPASVEPLDKAPRGRDEDLRRFGITTHEHTSYEWNGYRYTNATDAIAAAKRAGR
jgi:hypothetical protein